MISLICSSYGVPTFASSAFVHAAPPENPHKWPGNNHECAPTQSEAVIWWALKAVDTI